MEVIVVIKLLPNRRYIFALNFVQYFLPLGLISYAYIRIGLVSQFITVLKLFSVSVPFSKKRSLTFPTFSIFFPESVGEPRARRAGPAS